jgi:hypothetical protein
VHLEREDRECDSLRERGREAERLAFALTDDTNKPVVLASERLARGGWLDVETKPVLRRSRSKLGEAPNSGS